MTRRLRRPVPVDVRCADDGTPQTLYYRGRRRVTHIACTWDAPAAWWLDEIPAHDNPLLQERTHIRLIADECFVCELIRLASGAWYLSKIID